MCVGMEQMEARMKQRPRPTAKARRKEWLCCGKGGDRQSQREHWCGRDAALPGGPFAQSRRQVEANLLPKIQVDIVVSQVPVQLVIDTAKRVLYTGHIGDGKIFVYDVENVVKIRTGEEGYDALQDVE